MSLLADSIVDWGALLQVAYISAISGVAIASILGLGIVSELRAQEGGGGSAVALRAVTVVCVAVVAAAIVVGLYYLTDK